MAPEDDRKVLIAHGGASASAPEHTLDTYSSAMQWTIIEQGPLAEYWQSAGLSTVTSTAARGQVTR
jgi:hypothetical protein